MRRVLLKQATEGFFEGKDRPRRYYTAGEIIDCPLSDEELPVFAEVVLDDRAEEADEQPTPMSFSEAAGSEARVERACKALDPDDDAHWTESGLPAMEAVNVLAGPGSTLTRGDVNAWDPTFRRPD